MLNVAGKRWTTYQLNAVGEMNILGSTSHRYNDANLHGKRIECAQLAFKAMSRLLTGGQIQPWRRMKAMQSGLQSVAFRGLPAAGVAP